MLYSTEHPHLLDATYTETVLNVRPTPLDVVLRETLATVRADGGTS